MTTKVNKSMLAQDVIVSTVQVYPTLVSMIEDLALTEAQKVSVSEIDERGDYYISLLDEGKGVQLDNGKWANKEGGGGAMVPINSTIPINTGWPFEDALFTDTNGNVFLQTGFLETDTASYPDAVAVAQMVKGSQIAITATAQSIIGKDGNLWVYNSSTGSVAEYTYSGVLTGNTAALQANREGVTFAGSHWWLCDNGSTTFSRYDENGGGYLGVSVAGVSTSNLWTDLSFDGTFMWGFTDEGIYKFNTSGVYQNEFLPIASMGGVAVGSALEWIAGGDIVEVHTPTATVTRRNVNWEFLAQLKTTPGQNGPTGSVSVGTRLFVSDDGNTDRLYEHTYFESAVGDPIARALAVAGTPTYNVASTGNVTAYPYFIRIL